MHDSLFREIRIQFSAAKITKFGNWHCPKTYKNKKRRSNLLNLSPLERVKKYFVFVSGTKVFDLENVWRQNFAPESGRKLWKIITPNNVFKLWDIDFFFWKNFKLIWLLIENIYKVLSNQNFRNSSLIFIILNVTIGCY